MLRFKGKIGVQGGLQPSYTEPMSKALAPQLRLYCAAPWCEGKCPWKAHMQTQQSSSGKYIKQAHNTD